MKRYKLVSKSTGKTAQRHFETVQGARTHRDFVNNNKFNTTDYEIRDKLNKNKVVN